MELNAQHEEMYTIPKRYRVIENLHIVFWIIKDLCWCILYKPLAIAMIIPTLAIAITIAWQNRKIASELYHNLAVMFWIMANAYWMISEFYGFDTTTLQYGLTGKLLALIPFSIGMLCLAYYYIFLYAKDQKVKRANMVAIRQTLELNKQLNK